MQQQTDCVGEQVSRCNTCKYQKSDGWCSLRDLYTLMGLTQECLSYKPNEAEVARRNSVLVAENKKLRELFEKTYGYYVSGTLTPCDFCWRTDCEGPAPTTCEVDEYEPDGIVTKEIERLMHELGIEVDE